MRWVYNLYVTCYNRFVGLYNRYVDWHNKDIVEDPDGIEQINRQIEEENR